VGREVARESVYRLPGRKLLGLAALLSTTGLPLETHGYKLASVDMKHAPSGRCNPADWGCP
jgi:hypothetical protein